jgi:uncharacterized radical SAM superfamily Fe-S cluster-containing enzyme
MNNWHLINNAFSQPMSRAEDDAEYAPTQYLAEAFRNAGYDGIVYASQTAKGKNVALFDVNVAEIASRELQQVRQLSFAFTQVGPTSYVEKFKEQFKQESRIELPKSVD